MKPRDMKQPALAEWTRGAERFEALAAQIEARRPQAELLAAFADVCAWCEASGGREPSPETGRLLAHLKTAAQTWQQVWPRLGSQDEFRLTVCREARLWAKRLRATRPASANGAGASA